jgi:hypothetical protein
MENLDRQNKKLTQSLLRRGVDSNNFIRAQDLIPILNELENEINNIPALPIEPLKYKAIVSQTVINLYSGLLVVGQKYIVDVLEAGDDFKNVGYVSVGVIFTATGTTPTNWSNGSSVVDVSESQPVIDNLIFDTLPLTVSWGDDGSGNYKILFQTSGLFLANKTFFTQINLQRISDNLLVHDSGSFISIEFELYP